MDPWPFDDPRDLATITTRQVLREGMPILLVTHDESDGGWQFLHGGEMEAADGLVAGPGETIDRDPSLAELANLPLGWRAWREARGAPWQRRPAIPTDHGV